MDYQLLRPVTSRWPRRDLADTYSNWMAVSAYLKGMMAAMSFCGRLDEELCEELIFLSDIAELRALNI